MPQPLSDDAVAKASESVRDLKIIDPAVGSGHFLVVTVDLLWSLYREEARHRGLADDPEWTDKAIVERILEYNLHGIDLDSRAVQIAAAALWFAGRQISRDARPRRLNLVASNLRLGSLPNDDPALVKLRAEVERDIGMPGDLVDSIIHALRGADSLGSLLRIDRAVDEAIARHEKAIADRPTAIQKGLFGDDPKPARQTKIEFDATAARRSLLDRLESFLTQHTGSDDLGLRLAGEQLAAGVRFVRMVREGAYDLVVANPPYQGTSKMSEARYIEQQYPLGKADLYAAFLLRGLELVREGGVSAMLTMRNWMFLKQYAPLRHYCLTHYRLRSLHDLASGAFEEINPAQIVVSVASSVFARTRSVGVSVAIRAFRRHSVLQSGEVFRKRAASLVHERSHAIDLDALHIVPEWPLVYWWSENTLALYRTHPLVRSVAELRAGMQTANDLRFLRRSWELRLADLSLYEVTAPIPQLGKLRWAPYTVGAKGSAWVDALVTVIRWHSMGLEKQVLYEFKGSNGGGNGTPSIGYYLKPGVVYSSVGDKFGARLHRYRSLIGTKGASAFPDDPAQFVCVLNRSHSRRLLADLNPTVSFQTGDVRRLPFCRVPCAVEILAQLLTVFAFHECHREPSVEFCQPGPSGWRHAQEWAQLAVDRPEGTPLPDYIEELDPEPATDHLSYALGVALGRFSPNGKRILDPATADLSYALPGGILFLDRTLDGNGTADRNDGLFDPACTPLHDAWTTYGEHIDTRRRNVRDWLALDFFADVHKGMYENRPIHWPLSSESKTFVAWVNIQRFTDRTLRLLLADHLVPRLTQIEGEIADLRTARDGADGRAARAAEQRLGKLIEARDELTGFISAVEACADKGPPPTDAGCPAREQDARYAPDLDDGVMINSAALWPLLEPQWRDPKKWWKALAKAQGRKDYDWSHIAMRYWPARVDAKCQEDPSLAVAHGCFWRYHPARAWSWELRLQAEIGPDFRIAEPPYKLGGRDVGDLGDKAHRDAFLRGHAQEALEAVEKEAERRQGRARRRTTVASMTILEPGLWAAMPPEIWQMEMRLSERQGTEFRLLAPDEPTARAAYAAAHPDLAKDRVTYMSELKPVAGMFADGEDEDDLGDSDDEELAASDEEEIDVD